VKRNRVRRQLREVLRQATPIMRPGLYLIGLTRPAESITLADLRSAIDGLASKWSV